MCRECRILQGDSCYCADLAGASPSTENGERQNPPVPPSMKLRLAPTQVNIVAEVQIRSGFCHHLVPGERSSSRRPNFKRVPSVGVASKLVSGHDEHPPSHALGRPSADQHHRWQEHGSTKDLHQQTCGRRISCQHSHKQVKGHSTDGLPAFGLRLPGFCLHPCYTASWRKAATSLLAGPDPLSLAPRDSLPCDGASLSAHWQQVRSSFVCGSLSCTLGQLVEHEALELSGVIPAKAASCQGRHRIEQAR